MNICKNIKVPTGNILIVEGGKGKLECLSIGDYGKDVNLKADFMGLTKEIVKVKHQNMLPLSEKWVITISTQYGCSMNCKFCFDESAPILMSDYSYKRIKDIKIGDEVICNMNGETSPIKHYASLTTKTGIVTGIIKREYKGLMYKITTKDNHQIVCTNEHPIAKKYKSRYLFEKANNIKLNDKIVVSRRIKIENNLDKTWLIGWVIGFIYGDGTYDEIDTKRWMIAQKGKKLLNIAKNILEKNNINTSEIWNNGKDNWRFAIQGQEIDKFEKLINTYKNEMMYKKGFISGFWDAEGFSFQNNQCVRVCNTNKELISLVMKYLDELGYKTNSIYETNKEYSKTCYTLNISISRDLFNAEFTPFHDKRRYLHKQNSKSFCYLDSVINIETFQYDGIVYNFETSEHNYFAYDVLTHNCDVPKVGKGINATYDDLKNQIITGLSLHPEVQSTKRLNIHYARMGEPTWNTHVIDFTRKMRKELYPYIGKSLIHPVISTMLPKNNANLEWFLNEWMEIKNYDFRGDAGLQLSINSTSDAERDNMFSGNACSLEKASELGKMLDMPKGRKITLNFAVADYEINAEKLADLFHPDKFIVKLTPMHKTNRALENGIETIGDYTTMYPYTRHEEALKKAGLDVLVFIASEYEDLGRITCGNAILSGTLPECPYEEI